MKDFTTSTMPTNKEECLKFLKSDASPKVKENIKLALDIKDIYGGTLSHLVHCVFMGIIEPHKNQKLIPSYN